MDDEVGRFQIGRDRVRHIMLAQPYFGGLGLLQPGGDAAHIVVQHRQANLPVGGGGFVPVADGQHQVVAQEASAPGQPEVVAGQRLVLRTGLADQVVQILIDQLVEGKQARRRCHCVTLRVSTDFSQSLRKKMARGPSVETMSERSNTRPPRTLRIIVNLAVTRA